MNMFFGHNLLW